MFKQDKEVAQDIAESQLTIGTLTFSKVDSPVSSLKFKKLDISSISEEFRIIVLTSWAFNSGLVSTIFAANAATIG